MALVPAKCTQCGGNIEVDNTHEAGICQHCGTPFITEKAINNYNTFVTNNFAGANINVTSGNVDNLLKLAESVIEAGNGKEAIEYVNKALEINPECSKAWFLKMKSIEYIGTVGNPQVTEAISYAENAIKYSDAKEKLTEEVYKYYIKRAQDLLIIAISNLKDVEQIKNLASIGVSAAQGVASGDMITRNLYLNITATALILVYKIPEEYIKAHEDIQNEIVKFAKLLISVYDADTERLEVYYQRPTSETVQARKNVIISLKKGLNEDKASEINEDDVKEKEGGCYIATCVYGSYDCPQVWTLRRYRDYTLDETWYGKLFIKCYYAVSPKLVKWFGKYEWFKKPWKKYLDGMVERLNSNGVADTKYNDKY
ncbi:MAG: tetratricopeptide repeat protein [Ruminococcus sp.]|nr:tetratricopeptide repeat protein [Ruminococcus sp.]